MTLKMAAFARLYAPFTTHVGCVSPFLTSLILGVSPEWHLWFLPSFLFFSPSSFFFLLFSLLSLFLPVWPSYYFLVSFFSFPVLYHQSIANLANQAHPIHLFIFIRQPPQDHLAIYLYVKFCITFDYVAY